jgi:TPR repeat protein
MNQLKRTMALGCSLCGLMAVLAAEIPVVKGVPLADLIKKWESVPLAEVQKIATGGDVLAQHYLGYCYVEGERVSRDPVEGEKWYQRAMQAGYLSSANNLGLLYQRGLLGTNDYSKAISFYRFAAERGLDQAQVNLGILLKQGLAGTQDAQEAKRWFQLAADKGHPVAMVELGRLYRFGLGVEKNTAAAADWFEKAAREKNSTLAQLNLGLLYEAEKEPAKAFRNFERAAESGDSEAMVKVYFHYWRGNGVTRDHAKAMEWLKKSAEAKNPWAECLMGYQCEQVEWVGEGRERHLTKPDLHGALRWYRRSAAQGWSGGRYYLGMMYLKGEAVAPDEVRGLELIRAAADQNHDYALRELAALYARGVGEPRNESERPVALLERVGAWKDLLFRYQHGLGADRDVILAARAYSKLILGRGQSLDGREYHSPEDLNDKIEFKPSFNGPMGTPVKQAADWHLDLSGPVSRNGAPGDDVLRALSSYLKAALGDGAAALQLGKRYETGSDAPQSASKAWAWFGIAAQNRNPEAQGTLSTLAGQMNHDEMQRAQRWLANIQADLKEIAPYLR